MERVPLLIVYTGNGKGKTTAALGLVMRALGHNGRCAVIQFIKSPAVETGEKRTCKNLGVAWETYGAGFTWNEQHAQANRQACIAGWEQAKNWISAGIYDLIVLDEFTYALNEGYLPIDEVISWFEKRHKGPDAPHVIITGRNAPDKLVSLADMVQQVVEIKHPWHLTGLKAQKLIEY